MQLEGRQFPESSLNFSAASALAVFRFVHGESRPALRGYPISLQIQLESGLALQAKNNDHYMDF